jgi:hypothetical protein
MIRPVRIRSLPRSGRFLTLSLLGFLPMACSWWRYDEVTEKTPVLILEAPSGSHEIGKAVAAMKGKDDTAQVFTLGRDGYVLFDLGKREPTTTDATARGNCKQADGCVSAQNVAPILRDVDGTQTACFAYGLSQPKDEPLQTRLYCDGGLTHTLGLTDTTRSALGTVTSSSTLGLRFASTPRDTPRHLVAVTETPSTLWYYPSPSSEAVTIPIPDGTKSSFGRSIALLDQRFDSTEDGATLVVGDPDANRVYLLAVDDAGTLSATACIEGPSGFGHLLTTGYFRTSDEQSLVVGTASQLTVISALSTLNNATDCLSVDALSNATSLGCDNFKLDVDCDSALVNGSMTPADLNSDGIDELIVGVPSAVGEGYRAAGQVLTLSLSNDELSVRERLSPSSIESGDRIGESVVAVPLSRPDVVLAGAPGGNKLAAFYCSALLPAGLGGARCE